MKKSQFVFPLAALLLAFNTFEVGAQDARTVVQMVLARLAPNKQLPNDLIITGQVTDASGVSPFRITIKGKDQIKYELGSGASLITTTQFKGVGWREGANKKETLQPYSALQRPMLVPFFDLLAEADTPALQVADKGAVLLGATAARHFTLKLPDPSPETRMFGRALDEETDFYVDAVSGLILRSERWLITENNMNIRFRSITEFSDYRIVQGFIFPFRIVSTVSGPSRTTPFQSVYVFSNLQVNSGVPDSVFVNTEAAR